MEVTLVLRLERGIQTKESMMEKLDHVDLFVRKRVIGNKTKEVIY
jgi:hypothetical protein